MIDYYMAQVQSGNDSHAEYGKWHTKVRKLAIGESFNVTSDSDRRGALRAGNRLMMHVKSDKLSGGGYEITRINTLSIRRTGKPKKLYI